MRRDGTPIQTLLLRTFLPAVVVVAVLLATVVYNRLYATIIEGFDRKLVAASALTGAMIDPADHDVLLRAALAGGEVETLERSRPYLRNVEPMRRIRTQLGLTYLYSQAIGGSQDIVYVLDGTQGEDHSAIGSEDDLPDDTLIGLKRIQANGGVHVSPIEYQQQWGLLKTAAAPVHGSDGRITSTAGADVNISVIEVATQNALFASAMIGIGSIIACLIVALVIVRRVAGPIAALKQEALRIAAGDAALPAPIKGPREVAKLRDALAALAQDMTAALAHSREAAARHEREADEALLADDRAGGAVSRTPVPFRGGTGGGASPLEVAPGGKPHPNPRSGARDSERPEGQGLAPIGADTVRHLLALRGIAPFDALTESELLLVAKHVRFRRFAPDSVLLSAGQVAEMLFVTVEGQALTEAGPVPAVFDAAAALFGLPARSDYRAGPEGLSVLCLAKPHLFTIARECPDFIVGLAAAQARVNG